jgi:hypothetical protein
VSIHTEEVPCPCAWCQSGHASMHRVTRMWFDDETPPSPEAQAIMDEIVVDLIREAEGRCKLCNGVPSKQPCPQPVFCPQVRRGAEP